MIITSIAFGARKTQVAKTCSKQWYQACFHYSSVVSKNPSWETLKCPHGSVNWSRKRPAVTTWYMQHDGAGWRDPTKRLEDRCDADEYPPAYLLGNNSPVFLDSGQNRQGQLIRYSSYKENEEAGRSWKGVCFSSHVTTLSDNDVRNKVKVASAGKSKVLILGELKKVYAEVDVDVKPEFTFSSWGKTGAAPPEDGLTLNKCWPNGIAAQDLGFALLSFDPWYDGKAKHYIMTKQFLERHSVGHVHAATANQY